jgi:hypothetical protein
VNCDGCGESPCFRCQHEEGLRSWSAHDLVDARRELTGLVDRIDARLRELDGRATAGAPSLRVESEPEGRIPTGVP